MTGSRRDRTGEADDLADLPFVDEGERAEYAWLLARDADPQAPPPSPQIAHQVAELEGLLGDLPIEALDDSWHDDVLKRVAAPAQPEAPRPVSGPEPTRPEPPPRRRRAMRWALGGAIAAAAAAVAVLVLAPAPEELTAEVRPAENTKRGPRRSGDAGPAIGDHLVVTARSHGTADLRVYRKGDGLLVARCPGGPACTRASSGEYVIDLEFRSVGEYEVILVTGVEALPTGTKEAYMSAARAAKVRPDIYPETYIVE